MEFVVQVPELSILRRRQRRGPFSAVAARVADLPRSAAGRVGTLSGKDSAQSARPRGSYVMAALCLAAAAIAVRVLLERSGGQESEDGVPAPDVAVSAGDRQMEDSDAAQQHDGEGPGSVAPAPGGDETVAA